ncbi:DNA fragmentation factor subunit beta isoform X4 [Corythoichthys intestinalis]|uniref:DNA fragmentation factor subunit beta isoform X4 n=1 Tax=Corythoichthys intestinalis TaxID=161448 RepID=UPI0025A59EC4|nr:DNA fragmentation factor subunit beta isoform X4 [Corythoichthys intestinalis]XP_061803586.1 DNA fragmentation factor subunit beta-like [Nerophis lumbriciformis]
MFGKIRPFKIRSLNDNKKYGVAAGDIKELLKKGCNLLQLPLSGAHVCLYADGTKVTKEFFVTLPENTELVLLGKSQTWGGAICDVARLLSSDSHADDLIQVAKGLLSDEKSLKRQKILSDLIRNLEDTSELESRDEDQDWFTGVAARFKTKSAYLKDNCASRIRSYKKELDEAVRSERRAQIRIKCLQASEKLTQMLRSDKNIGCYFDRTQKEMQRLCTREGWFTCQGSFDQAKCLSLHSINPYGSRERRILFSTWNLDHRIEKKRSVIPALLEALHNHKCEDVNLDYFYRLLFTWDNLKLVHIVCHKKEAHNLQCDPQQILKADNKKRHRKKMRLK